MQPKLILTSALWLAVTEAAHAQGTAFNTPGMPGTSSPGAGYGGNLGQTTRFSNEFNPAIGLAIDGFGDYQFFHDNPNSSQDGFDLKLRTLELTASSWVDPKAWAYVVLASDGTSLNLEEAAVHYIGLGGNTTLRAGRFFIDFGKQMQGHIHDLRTVDRPAVLSAYLGEEVHGDGLEFDNWFAAGETAAVRYSVGVFADLIPETFEGAGDDIAASVDDRKKFEHLNFTARITGFEDIGDNGIGQIGASARVLPQFTLSSTAGVPEQTDLMNTVYGLDATYGWTDDTGIKKWTVGGEGLLLNGDAGGSLDSLATPTSILLAKGNFFGFYAFGDYQWDRFNSAGVQYSRFEQPSIGGPDEGVIEVYYSHSLSEFQRLRFAVQYEHNEVASDSTRIIIQYTNFLGAHSHGVNW